jgi:methyl-accepting chemotaxis protein
VVAMAVRSPARPTPPSLARHLLGEVGEVVKVIDPIAEQANLLAFNASMKHPRRRRRQGVHGHRQRGQEAGPVHPEGDADIAIRIQAIQADAGSAVTAIDEIGSVISRINEIQTMIAGGAEE